MDGSRPPTGICSSWLSPPVKSSEFFKFIDSSSVQRQNLILPKTFVREYGKNLSNLVHLKVPTGAVWKVKLLKSNDKTYLSNGWEEFAKYYSIGLWHYLIFRYYGNSTFHVIIFDMTASEIEYPPNPTDGDQMNRSSNKKLIIHIADEEGTSMSNSVKMSGNKSFKACEIASGFKSDNPFFTAIMHKSSFVKRCNLNVPSDFAKKYIRQDKNTVELHISDGRVWFAKCYRRMDYYYYRLDFFSFARDNGIEVGDVCIFELIDPRKLSMNVTIVRKSQH